MAKDKKAKKGDKPAKHAKAPKGGKAAKGKKKDLVKAETEAEVQEVASRPHPLEALNRLADHPLVSELLSVGALAAVAAVAEAASRDPAAVRSAEAAKKAGKAAATAIGTRLLKEFSGSGKKDGAAGPEGSAN